jgi:hypothetical protein
MEKRARIPLEQFLSLSWYDTLLRFASNFVAKSSEVLLTVGLMVSSANFLTDGSIVKQGTMLSLAWAWIQSIAIDGSLGTSFYRVLIGLKERDWITCIFSAILTILLTGVAWITVEGDTLSHAANTSIEAAMHMIGIDVRLLSLLRAIAVVGVVLMSRLHEVSFREHTSSTKAMSSTHDEDNQHTQACSQHHTKAARQVLEEHPSLTTEMTVAAITASQEQPVLLDQLQEKQALQQESAPEAQSVRSDSAGDHQEQRARETTSFLAAYDERLRQAYDALQAGGEKITGRALAQRAHVRRSTSTAWLRSRQTDMELHLQKRGDEAHGEDQTTPLVST